MTDVERLRDQCARLSARLESIENAALEFTAAWDQAHSFEIANLPTWVRIAAAKLRDAVGQGKGTVG